MEAKDGTRLPRFQRQVAKYSLPIIADGEAFWGYDRLEDLGVRLDTGGW